MPIAMQINHQTHSVIPAIVSAISPEKQGVHRTRYYVRVVEICKQHQETYLRTRLFEGAIFSSYPVDDVSADDWSERFNAVFESK